MLIVLPSPTSISGRIQFPANQSPVGWTIDLVQDGRSASRVLGSKRTPIHKDGGFEIPGIEPGKGTLYLFPPGAPYGWDMAGLPVGGTLITDFDALPGETVRVDVSLPGK